MKTQPIARRFWTFVAPMMDDRGCWEWVGNITGGYGQFSVDARPTVAHRVAYELLVGPIPRGLEVDHLCFNKTCVNPQHLEPVTRHENLKRRSARRMLCKYGHPLEQQVTHPEWRFCRTCARRMWRDYQRKIRSKHCHA